MDRLTPRLWTWVHLRLGPSWRRRIDVGDVVQSIWCRALGRGSAPPAPGQLFALARYVLLEAVRDARRAARVEIPGGRSSVVRQQHEWPGSVTQAARRVERDEVLQLLWRRAALWSDADRLLFRLVGIEGSKQRDVADALGVTREVVAKRWQRMRAELGRIPELGLE